MEHFEMLNERVNSVTQELKKNEYKHQDFEKRLLALEISKEKTEYQYEQIMDTLKTLNDVTIPNLVSQIEELKNKPVKRYDQAISSILGAFFGSIGTLIATWLFKK